MVSITVSNLLGRGLDMTTIGGPIPPGQPEPTFLEKTALGSGFYQEDYSIAAPPFASASIVYRDFGGVNILYDIAYYNSSGQTLFQMKDFFVSISEASESLFSGRFLNADDFIRGNNFADRIKGFDGDDRLIGLGGSDTIFGQGGVDRILGGDGNDILSGGAGDDEIDSGSGRDFLRGDAGNDVLRGRGGADTVDGGQGSDTLIGGPGADVFVLRRDGARDVVRDYEDGVDRLDFGASFRELDIETVKPGHVRIVHRGDILDLFDKIGTLSAEDITPLDLL